MGRKDKENKKEEDKKECGISKGPHVEGVWTKEHERLSQMLSVEP